MKMIDELDPAGIERRREDHARLQRMQDARTDATYGTILHYALTVAIDVHIGAQRCLIDDMERLARAIAVRFESGLAP